MHISFCQNYSVEKIFSHALRGLWHVMAVQHVDVYTCAHACTHTHNVRVNVHAHTFNIHVHMYMCTNCFEIPKGSIIQTRARTHTV